MTTNKPTYEELEKAVRRLLATDAPDYMPFGAMGSFAAHTEFDKAWSSLVEMMTNDEQ